MNWQSGGCEQAGMMVTRALFARGAFSRKTGIHFC
jgi:hypothetical protein